MNLRTTMLRPLIVLALVAGMVAALVGLFEFNGPSPVSAQADNTAPTISSLAITSDTGDDDTNFDDDGVYGIGDSIKVTVTFSESVSVTGTPQLELDIGDGTGDAAEYESVAGSAVVFSYTVAEGDLDDDGIAIGANKLTLNSGSIKDAADNAANLSHDALSAQTGHKVDGVRPTISSVSLVSSTGGSDGVYTAGETLTASVDFDEDVIVSGGPQLELDFEGTVKLADFSYADPKCEGPFCFFSPGPWAVRGIQLKFDYTVLSGDSDSDGAAVGANAVSLNGGAIKDAAGNDAELTHDAVADDPGHKVSAVPPPPGNVRAVSQERGEVKLTWKAPDNSRVTGYGIERRRAAAHGNNQQRSAGGPTDHHILVEDTGSAETGYTDESAEKGVEYEYQVSARNEAGPGEASGWVRANSPATGLPTISGTAQVGETLTADTFGIADEDGLDNATFTYQWLADETAIQGATGYTYTLADADEGQTIKVRISFTDDADNQEMLTSAPTAAVAAPAQADSEDEPSELSYLTVVVAEDDSDPDNVVTTFTITWNDAEDCSASYNAYLDGVVGDPIHLGSAASEGEQIAASLTNVSAESIGFDAKLYCGMIGSGRLVDSLMIPEYSRSFDTVPISRAYLPKPGTYSTEPGLTVLTVSSGTLTPAFHSKTLNYTVPDVANADGRITLTTTTKADYYTVAFIPGSLYFYISLCSHGGQQTSVSYQDDTGNPLYPLTDADANTPGFQMELDEGENVFKIRVWPNCESGHVYKLTVTRAANAPANTPATGAPTIGGAAQVGETLTVDTSGIADADGLSGATFSYQWLSSRDTEIQGATDAAYILVPGDASKTIKVRVSFTDDEGNAETLTSAATGAVAPRPNSPATGAPTIGGTAQVGETLTVETSGIADADGLTGATFSYQWLSSRDTEIGGATSSTYTLVAADEGKAIKVRISFTDDADNQETLTSVATTAVAGAVDSGAPSYITVEVTEDYSDPINIVTNFAITWSDAAVCSVDYNAYLNIKPSTLTGDETEGSQLHLGSAASDGAQITAGLTGVQGGFRGFDVELYCGTDGSGRLVSRVVIPGEYTRPKPGTYSSEPPLSALGVSHGTMTPTFQGGTSSYTVPDVANAETRTTITATPTEGNFVKFFEGSDSPVIGLIVDAWGLGPRPSGLSEDCSRGFGDYYGPLIEMTDADPDTPGFQVDLYDGTSSVWVHVYPTAICSLGKSYALTITRAEGEISLPRPNRPAIGLPVIAPPGRDPGSQGTYLYFASPCVGCTMNAYVSSIKDRDGWDESTFSYQWLADDAEITGATDFSYTVADTDLGKTLKVRVSFTDGRGNEETLTSLATEVVRLRNFWPTGKPVILGTPEVGQTLRVDVSGISDPNGMTNAAFTYQWVNTPWTDSNEYTLADRDEGRRIWLRAAYTDDAGHRHVLESESTDAVAARPSSPATGAPTIRGTAQVGETLTVDTSGIADENGLENVAYTYQWLSSRDNEIGGATSSTYTLQPSDEGKTVKVQVSFTDDAGNNETLTSAATDPVVSAALPPPPDNLRAVTQKSGAVELNWHAPDDATVTGYRIDRRRAGGDRSDQQRSAGSHRGNHTLVEDTGSADTGYTDKSAEKGVEYEYRVSARNEAGAGEGSEWVRAGPEEEPVLGDGLPGAPRNLAATPGNKEITLSWEPPADNGNAPATRYRIEWRVDGKDYDKNHWGTARSTTYTTNDQANLANGVKYFFRVKAENDDGNSYGPYGPASEEVSATPTSGSAVDLGTPVLSEPEYLHHGMVQLDWQDIEDAGWYVVQYYHMVKGGEWLDLPAVGVDIAFHGSSAVVSNLHGLSWLRVRAMSCAGESEWSQIEQLFGTNKSDWEGVPVPDVEEGDEIEPCPVVLGTPVLSDTETLHHGMVRLDWQDIEDAGRYVVQYYHLEDGEWLDLPAEGVDIAFHGSSAVVSNLHGLSWLRVRAMSCTGESEWSQIEQLFGTNASDWKGVPVPDVAEGDEIEPCSEDADTSDNSPATGAPTISGTAQVGETLTADTSGITDLDGFSNVQYEYQWLADDSDISGTTNATYTLVAEDEGKAIKVEVTFTDDAGNEEELTSGATDAVTAAPQPNSPATGAPTITGTAQVGEALTADTSGIADADGLENVSFSYEWLADDTAIQGATNSTYTLADADEGKTIKVRVSFTDDAGNEETLTSGEVGPVVSPQRIVVSPNCGQTVDFAVEAYDHEYVSLLLRKPNNLDITNFVLQRYEHDGAEFVSSGDVRRIEGELSSSLPSCSDLWWVDFIVEPNTLYKYTYELKDDSGSIVIETSLTVRTPPIPDSTGVADATLSDLTLSGIDFVPTLAAFYFVGPFLSDTVSYVGEAANSVTQTRVSPTLGHAGAGYVIMVDGVPDVDGVVPLSLGSSMVTVEVTAEDDTTTRTYTITVTRTANTPATGAPTISGTAQVGETLTADTSGVADADGLSNVQYEYQWLADDAAIAGAIGSTYTPVAADEGKTIKAEVSFTDDAGNDETLTSAATEPVEAAPAANSPATGVPTISGTAQVGETLMANTTGVADADGLSNVQYEYQWLASRDTEIQGATGSSYTVQAADEGKTIGVQVSFTDDGGNAETLTSGATDAVSAAPTPNSPATGAPTINGTAQVGETLTADTSGIADADGLSSVQYEYQWLADDAGISGATNATYTLADADEGKAVKVEVSFTDDAGNKETLTSAATDAVATAEPSEPPDKPKDLAATATHDSVTLTWKDPGDDSITGYVILRRVRVNDQGGDFSVLVADTGSAATTYTDDTVAAGTTYTYRIKAINEHGVSERSRWFHIDTPADPVPAKPTELSATATHDQVVLTWDDPGDDSITGYVILRRVRVNDTGGDFSVLVANTESAATTYADNTVAASTTYTYRIKAINEHGTSERSRWSHIDTPAAP